MSPKETIRNNIKNLLKNAAREEFASQGEKAAVILSNSPYWSRCSELFLFLSMDSEIDTKPLLEISLKENKKVFAPRIEADDIVFCPIFSPRFPCHTGPFGLREPETPAFFPAPSQKGALLVLAPGLAFDRKGNRLGRGRGYYDRFFAKLDTVNIPYKALGFCMDFQLLDQVPAANHDKKMTGILTGKELIHC